MMLELRTRVAIATWTARLTPLVLISMAGYVTYVLVSLLSVKYLLTEQNDKATAISILVTYFLILIFLIASFLRLTYTTYCDPPYVPLGKGNAFEQVSIGTGEYYNDKESFIPPDLKSFYEKDVFISDHTGRPYWCSSCANWKPDRAHHCSQTGRCIRKMDHFCPWVGGPVGENNFKFFIQFTSYGALYCTYVLTVVASLVSKKKRREGEKIETALIITLGLACAFLLFSGGMTLHGIRLATKNLTQIEKIGMKKRVYTLAAYVPLESNSNNPNNALQSLGNQSFIYYPLVSSTEQMAWPISSLKPSTSETTTNLFNGHLSHTKNSSSNGIPKSTQSDGLRTDLLENSQAPQESLNLHSQDHLVVRATVNVDDSSNLNEENLTNLDKLNMTDNAQLRRPKLSSQETLSNQGHGQGYYRTFVILRTHEGENPWDLGSRLLNWKSVMGDSILDWFLPLRRSPCCNHDDPSGQFKFGFAVQNLRSQFGLLSSEDTKNIKIL